LRRRWSLSGRRFRGVETTIFHYAENQKSNGGHRSDRTLDRTRSLFDRTCPVSVQRARVFQLFDWTRGASGHSRSDASGHRGSLLDSNRTRALWRPVSSSARLVTVSLERCSDLTSASSPSRDQRVRSSPARPAVATSASGRCFTKIAVV
jgi:hypothetical protein